MVAVGKLHGQRSSGIPRADQHDVFHAVGVGEVADAPLRRPEQPIGKPNGNGADEAEQEAHHHAGAGHQIAVKAEHQHADHAQHRIRAGNTEHLRRTDEGPDGVIQPEKPEYQKRDHAPGANGGQETVQMDGANFGKGKIIPKPQSQKEGDGSGKHVQQHNQNDLRCHAQIQFHRLSGTHFVHILYFTAGGRLRVLCFVCIVHFIITQYVEYSKGKFCRYNISRGPFLHA